MALRLDNVGIWSRASGQGAQLVSNDVVQCEDVYRLCYVRGLKSF